MEGQVLFNGSKLTKTIKKRVGYVLQGNEYFFWLDFTSWQYKHLFSETVKSVCLPRNYVRNCARPGDLAYQGPSQDALEGQHDH